MSWIFACGLRFNRKSQPCIYFRWFALHFQVKTYAKKQPATGRFAGFIVRENNRFLLLGAFDNRLQKAPPCFFAYVFTRKWSANLRKKIQGCDFLLNWRPHAKIQVIWTKKKNRPKFDIEWLCSKTFNCYISTLILLTSVFGCRWPGWKWIAIEKLRLNFSSCFRMSPKIDI